MNYNVLSWIFEYWFYFEYIRKSDAEIFNTSHILNQPEEASADEATDE